MNGMQTLTLKSHIGEDGILHLDIPLGLQNKTLEIVLVVQAVADDVATAAVRSPLPKIEAPINLSDLDTASKQWLDSELTEPLPEYDWGPEGLPEGMPVKYVPGQGMVIMAKNES